MNICLNIFLNSQLNASSTLSDRLNQTKGACQSWSCPWNILSLAQVTCQYRRCWLRCPEGCPKWKISYVGFISFFMSVFVFPLNVFVMTFFKLFLLRKILSSQEGLKLTTPIHRWNTLTIELLGLAQMAELYFKFVRCRTFFTAKCKRG